MISNCKTIVFYFACSILAWGNIHCAGELPPTSHTAAQSQSSASEATVATLPKTPGSIQEVGEPERPHLRKARRLSSSSPRAQIQIKAFIKYCGENQMTLEQTEPSKCLLIIPNAPRHPFMGVYFFLFPPETSKSEMEKELLTVSIAHPYYNSKAGLAMSSIEGSVPREQEAQYEKRLAALLEQFGK